MNPRRLLPVGLAVLAASSIVFGTAGFTAVEANRTVSVSVVDQQNAYVGVVACAKSGSTNSQHPVHVWVTNRFSETVTVTAIEADSGETYSPPGDHGVLDPGEKERYEATFAADSVTVVVDGDGVNAAVTVPVKRKADCPEQYPSDTSTANNSTANNSTTASG